MATSPSRYRVPSVFTSASLNCASKYKQTSSVFLSQLIEHRDQDEVMYLGSITSDPFKGGYPFTRGASISDHRKVLLPKDFKGMEESTYLSRAFSDQGVRLRLRKEPRAMMYVSYATFEFRNNTYTGVASGRIPMALTHQHPTRRSARACTITHPTKTRPHRTKDTAWMMMTMMKSKENHIQITPDSPPVIHIRRVIRRHNIPSAILVCLALTVVCRHHIRLIVHYRQEARRHHTLSSL